MALRGWRRSPCIRAEEPWDLSSIMPTWDAIAAFALVAAAVYALWRKFSRPSACEKCPVASMPSKADAPACPTCVRKTGDQLAIGKARRAAASTSASDSPAN